MKIKMITIALLAGFINMGANAGFEQFSGPNGFMEVFNNSGGLQGGFVFDSPWGLADLQALTEDNRTFELLPNINAYNASDPFWSDGAGDGNKFMVASTYFELSITNETSASFTFDVDAFDLDSRYELFVFLKVLDPANGYSTEAIDDLLITTTGSNINLNVDVPLVSDGMILQAGCVMNGLNANPDTDWGSATITMTELYADTGDETPPSPDPMGFALLPDAISDQAISMTASNATDTSGVEYFFTCTNNAAHSSEWQSDTTYVATGLVASTPYTFTVKARDLSISNNTTAASAPATISTDDPDTISPEPSTMTFAIPPTALSPATISMTATTATDDSGVEYKFICTAGGGNDSPWQDSTNYVDTGLTGDTEYTYTVIARDLSIAQNSNTVSVAASATTPALLKWMVNSLTNYTGDTSQQATLTALGFDSLGYSTPSATAAISFDGSGATFGEGTNYVGRNILRTIGTDYDESSFEAYATFVFDGVDDQAAFMGMGQGIIDAAAPGNYGVPELSLQGVNGTVAEMKTSASSGDIKGCNLLKINGGNTVTNFFSDPLALVDTFRVKLAYDSSSNTVTISVDTNYTPGVAFSADRVLGTIDTTGTGTTNMWYGAPVHVYAGGGEGTVVSDLVIKADPADIIVDDLAIAGQVAGDGKVLQWSGSAGQVYDVLYKTDLVTDPTWEPDTSASDIFATASGTVSATSTVSSTEAFYKVIAK